MKWNYTKDQRISLKTTIRTIPEPEPETRAFWSNPTRTRPEVLLVKAWSLKGAWGKNTAHFCLIVCLKRSKTYAFLTKQFVSELALTLQHSDWWKHLNSRQYLGENLIEKIFYRQGHTIILVFLFIVQGGPVYGTQWWKCALQDPRWCRKESNTFTYIPAFSTSWILLMNMCEICFFRPLFQKIHVFSISDIWCTMTRETETTSK